MNTIRLLAVLPLFAVACGFGGKSSSNNAPKELKGGSCLEAKTGICTEYDDNTLGLAEGACTSMNKGTWSKQACSTADVVGTCKKKNSKVVYYVGNGVGPWVDDAKADCEETLFKDSKGVFTATAGIDQTAKDRTLPDANHIWGSCARKDGKSCTDSIGRSLTSDFAKSACESDTERTWSASPCPTDKLVGSCVQPSAGNVDRNYSAMLSVSSAKEMEKFCSGPKEHWYASPNAPAAPAAPATVALAKGKPSKAAPAKRSAPAKR